MSSAPDVVIGQGTLGTLLATVLAQTRDVRVVSRRAEGAGEVTLSARGRGWRREAEVEVAPKPPAEARLVVVATRADEALARAQPLVDRVTEEGVLVPVQNGLVSLDVADEVSPERVVPAIVGFNARMEDERSVEVTSPGEITVGAMHEAARPGLVSFAEAVDRPLGVQQTRNPRGAVWSKWCVSCAINGLAVVTGAGVGTITRQRAGREALVGVLTEGTRVAAAEGVELERVAGPLSPDTVAGNATSGLGGAFRRGVVWLIGRRYREVTPSSIDALREGRDPELATLNAEAVDRGQTAGVATPWNQATLALAQQVVDGEREPSMDNLAELRRRAANGSD